MANLFWGVSDALDLYGEYVEAKAQMASRVPAQRENAGHEVAFQMKNESIPIISFNSQPNIEDDDETAENADEGHLETNAANENNPLESQNQDEQTNSNDKSKINEDEQAKPIELDEKGIDNDQNFEESKKTEKNDDELEQDLTHQNDANEIQNEIKSEIKVICEQNQSDEKSSGTVESQNNEENRKEETSCDLEESNSSQNDGNDLTPTTAAERLETGEDQKSLDEMEKKAECNNEGKDEENYDENPREILNILIFGGGDPRHIIKTMAKRYTHCRSEGNASKVPLLKFYIIDGSMEIVARNILLLGIALEKPEQLSLRNKVHLFMDIYGNSLLRPISHQYMISKSTTLLKMASDSETLKKIAPFVHFEDLKYREIDSLQDAFEFWQPKPGHDFKIKEHWLNRLQRLLAVRYDAREGVFDWDLNMSLKDRGCEQICSQEYRYWRETGIAFTFPEYEQCKPNKTLAAGLTRNGGRYLHHGYVGDIQTGPFCTFGLRSLEERMHHSAHGQNDYRATDVTERNLLEYFHELQSGTPYEHNNDLFHKYGGVRFQMGERLTHNECDFKNISAYDQPWIKVEGIEVHFLPLEEVFHIGKGAIKWQNYFHIAFIGYKYFEFLTDTFPKVLRKDSLTIFETKLRSVEIKNRIKEFETDLLDYARCAHLMGVLNYNALNSKNSVLKFWKNKTPHQK